MAKGALRRRPAAAGFGVALALAAGVWIGGAWYLGSNVNLNPYKPVWLLRVEADRHGTATAEAALDELVARLANGKLGVPTIDALVQDALAVQGDAAIVWDPSWGEIVEQSWDQGHLSEAEWHDYLKAAVTPALSLEVRQRVMRGDPILVGVVRHGTRLGDRPFRIWYVRTQPTRFEIDGVAVESLAPAASASKQMIPGGRSSIGRGVRLDDDAWAGLETGTRQAAQTVRLELFVVDPMASQAVDSPVVVFEHRMTTTFELTDISPVRAVVIEEHREAMRDAFKTVAVRFIPGSPGRFQLNYTLDRPPVGFAFEVVAIDDDGREVEIVGTASGVANHTGSVAVGSSSSRPWTQPTADLLFRPSEGVARTSSNVSEYWGEEILFEDVPVDLPAAVSGARE
ncbi:MAG: hypothetical protein AAF078_05090 [Planctomycetota bacterium]